MLYIWTLHYKSLDAAIQPISYPSNIKSVCNLEVRMLWETISNAFQNSREVTSVGFPLSLIQPLHCHLFLNGCDTPFCPVTVCLTSWNTARMSDLNLPNDTPYHMMLCSAVNLRERMKRVVTVFVFPSKRYVC